FIISIYIAIAFYVCVVGLVMCCLCVTFFFLNVPATTEIYTLSLHDALPIFPECIYDFGFLWFEDEAVVAGSASWVVAGNAAEAIDRKSTRLNSSHLVISYAVFCLKKKNQAVETCPILSIRRFVAKRLTPTCR